MSWKKFIVGEKMPDINDPKYKKRAEREMAAGEWFARKTGLVKLAAKVQRSANRNPKRFLAVSFGIVILGFFYTVGSMIVAYNHGRQRTHSSTAVEQVDSAMKAGHKGLVMPRR